MYVHVQERVCTQRDDLNPRSPCMWKRCRKPVGRERRPVGRARGSRWGGRGETSGEGERIPVGIASHALKPERASAACSPASCSAATEAATATPARAAPTAPAAPAPPAGVRNGVA